MIQYIGSDKFHISIGDINQEMSMIDLNSLLDELKDLPSLDYKIGKRIIDDSEVDDAIDATFNCGFKAGRLEI